jgi:hypothetical protein
MAVAAPARAAAAAPARAAAAAPARAAAAAAARAVVAAPARAAVAAPARAANLDILSQVQGREAVSIQWVKSNALAKNVEMHDTKCILSLCAFRSGRQLWYLQLHGFQHACGVNEKLVYVRVKVPLSDAPINGLSFRKKL